MALFCPLPAQIAFAVVPCDEHWDLLPALNLHIWDFLFTLMIVTAIVGNTAVIWIVISESFQSYG